MHHSGVGAYIDYTGGLNLRNGTGTIDTFNFNNSTNQGTFNYNLNTNGITNSSTNAINNSGTLTQTGAATFSTNITAPSISTSTIFYAGQLGNTFDTSAISAPKITNGIASGTADGTTYTAFNLAINSWYGVGFVYSNPSGPSVCKLVINNRSGDLSTLGTITCNTLNTSNYNAGTTYNTGSIYMTNASPIYLKSNTDSNHYIKYDLTNEGPQLGFYGTTTMKCTENNAIIMKVSKTAVDINASTTIIGNCVISNKCTVQNGTVLNGEINQSKYFTLKGYTINNATAGTTFYNYTKFDGSSDNLASENFQMPSSCGCTKITYAYNSTYPSNVFQGVRE